MAIEIWGLSITISVAIIQARYATVAQKQSKRADVIAHCNIRYDEIYRTKTDIANGNTDHVDFYFARYWGLKSDQFDYWLHGWVDIETFCSWYFSTLLSFRRNENIGLKNFKEGWEHQSSKMHKFSDPWFTTFISNLIKISETREPTIQDLIAEVEKLNPSAKRWRRKISGGFFGTDMSLSYYKKSLASTDYQ